MEGGGLEVEVLRGGMGQMGDGAVCNFTAPAVFDRSEEHTSELQSLTNLVCRLLLEKKKYRDFDSKLPHL